MSYFYFAWIASITYGVYTIVAKLIGKYQLKNTWQFSFFSMLFGGIVMSVIALFYGAGIPSNWGFLIVAGVMLALVSFLYLFSLKILDVSVLAPLYNIQTVSAVILGWLFLGEIITSTSFWLISVVVIAGFFATMDEKFSLKSFFARSTLIGLVYMLALSIQRMFINLTIEKNSYWTTMLWLSIIAPFVGFIFMYPKFKSDLNKTPPKKYLGVFILSFLGGLGDLAAYKAFEGNLGISSVIISLPISMVLAFLFSIFKPKLLEKHTLKVYFVRFVAAAVMIWGALQLSG